MIEIAEDKLDDRDDPLTIERIRENLPVKFDLTNEQSVPRTPIEDEKTLSVKSQYKGTCMTWGKYGHTVKDCWYKEGTNVPKYHYCDKSGHFKKYCWKRIMREKAKNNKNGDNKKK